MDWLPSIFRRRSLYKELAEEMREHLEERTEQLEREGMSRAEAERGARRAFGNPTLLEERSREIWQWPTLESIWADVKYALRQLRKSPGFTITVILSLALGLGANTTIFTLVNALLFVPPAVSDASGLSEVLLFNPKAAGLESHLSLSYPSYTLFRDHNHTLSGFAAFDGDPHVVSWHNSGYGQMVHGQIVSGNFFSVIGVHPVLGREFNADEDRAGTEHPAVVVSYAFWKNRLNGESSAIGSTMVLNGTAFTIVGVAPGNFNGVLIASHPDFWAPIAMAPMLTREPTLLSSDSTYWLFGVGRKKQDASKAQMQADLSILAHTIPHRDPNEPIDASVFPLQLVPTPFRGYVAAFTGMLMAAVGLVLLIACANAANLLLGRAMARRRELAVRTALGASRSRIIRQTLTESLLLSLAGGAIGLVLASWSIPLLLSLKPASIPFTFEVALDWRVYIFALALSLFAGVVFGIAPAMRSPRRELISALKDETQIAGPRRSWLRDSIVVLQITVCLVLLISAGLCVRSLLNARSINPGFITHDVVIAQLDPGSLGYTDLQKRAFYQQLVDHASALPGVSSASLTSYLPLGTERMVQPVTVDGFTPPPPQEGFYIQTANVAPSFFSAMGIPLLSGRDFTPSDIDPGVHPVVINQAMANRFWPRQNPVGRHFKVDKDTVEIVGIVPTGKYRNLSEDPTPFLYRPFNFVSRASLVVRSRPGAGTTLDEIRQIVFKLDPNVVPEDMESISQYMALPLFAAHTTGVLLAAFGAVALLLATIGLSGVVSYSVSQRTNEIGVRMALGANRRTVLAQVLRQGMRLTVVGIVLGLALSFAVTRLLAGLLYGIGPGDPLTYLAVSLFLATVALASCYFPAHRAASIDPMQALRAE
jgi:predicted permease